MYCKAVPNQNRKVADFRERGNVRLLDKDTMLERPKKAALFNLRKPVDVAADVTPRRAVSEMHASSSLYASLSGEARSFCSPSVVSANLSAKS